MFVGANDILIFLLSYFLQDGFGSIMYCISVLGSNIE